MSILDNRRCGILLPIFSLNSNYGIGTLGQAAYDFVDFLKECNQTYWQILPTNPTTRDNSPYKTYSSMAGNELLIDLDLLIDDGLIDKKDVINYDFGVNKSKVSYKKIRLSRQNIFKKVIKNFKKNIPEDFFEFCEVNKFWLDDYARFMSIKEANNNKELKKWPNKYKHKEQVEISRFIEQHETTIDSYKILQYIFHVQFKKLKEYANNCGIYLIGDIPIYVAHDSADVWSNQNIFKLDKNLDPIEVAGTPPDVFSEEGQLWGNPVYNWNYLKDTQYKWWIKRIQQTYKYLDVIRLDHFRGFESYYTIKANQKSAKNGFWRQGPGISFFDKIEAELGKIPIIAEDLGFITNDVKQLLKRTQFPGMKVLQFAFTSKKISKTYIPYSYSKNCVCYVGNHDNNTLRGWIIELGKKELIKALEYYDLASLYKLHDTMIRSALSSVANTCILTIQDILKLGKSARINTPSTISGNWTWRVTTRQLESIDVKKLKNMMDLYGRCPEVEE